MDNIKELKLELNKTLQEKYKLLEEQIVLLKKINRIQEEQLLLHIVSK